MCQKQFRYPLWVSLTESEKQSGPDILCFLCLFKILRFTDKRYLLYHKILILYKHNFLKLYGNSKSLKCFFMGEKSQKILGKEKKMNEKSNLRVSNNIYIQNSQILLWKFVNVIWDEIEFSTFPISSNFQQQQ